MKFYIYYNIWDKQDHIALILRGINCFAPNCFFDITFETPKDLSETMFNQYKGGFLKSGYRQEVVYKKYMFPNVNDAVERFMNSDCDIFINPQDDQFLQDSNLLDNIAKLYNENENVGLVGLRDGMDLDMNIIASSNFSHKDADKERRWLRNGEYVRCTHVNSGPLILSRETINRVGLFDNDFVSFYVDTDYSLRCNKAGLTNFVMGSEWIHQKFGSVTASDLYYPEDGYSAHDMELLRLKHSDIYG